MLHFPTANFGKFLVFGKPLIIFVFICFIVYISVLFTLKKSTMLFNDLSVSDTGYLTFTDRKTKQKSTIKKALIDDIRIPSYYVRQKNKPVQSVGYFLVRPTDPANDIILLSDGIPFASFKPSNIAFNGVSFRGTLEELINRIKSILE